MNEHILTNYGIIRTFHDQGKSIISALLPLVEYGISTIQDSGKDYYDTQTLNENIFNESGVKIPLLTLKNLLKILSKDGSIDLFGHGEHFRILDEKSISSKQYIDEITSMERRVNKFISEYKKYAKDSRSDAIIKENLYQFIQFKTRNYGISKIENEHLTKKEYEPFYKFLEFISYSEQDLFKTYQDINFGFTLCSLLEKENELDNIKLQDFIIYLDSNFILRLLDLQEKCFTSETNELFELLKKSGATIKVFEETIHEVMSVIEYYKHSYQINKNSFSNYFEASNISSVLGAFFRRKLTITEIDKIIDNIYDNINALGIKTDTIERYNLPIENSKVDTLYELKYGNTNKKDTDYRYNKCKNYISIINIIKWLREKHKVNARCFGNCNFIFLTCDWKLYRYNLKHTPLKIKYPEVIIQEAIVDNLMLYFPEQYSTISTDLLICVYQSSQYLNFHDLDKLCNNMQTLIEENSTLSSYVVSATKNIENYSRISEIYDEANDPLPQLRILVQSQKDIEEKKKDEEKTLHEEALNQRYKQGKEDQKKDDLRIKAKFYARLFLITKYIIAVSFICATIIIMGLILGKVIILPNINDDIKWLISTLISVISIVIGILGIKFINCDEAYFYKKLCKKNKIQE